MSSLISRVVEILYSGTVYLLFKKARNKQKIIEEGLGSKNTLENDYLKFLDLHKLSSGIITDKAPQNFRWIGFMKIFFPNCKVIHCSRDSKDNCLSIFKNAFASI